MLRVLLLSVVLVLSGQSPARADEVAAMRAMMEAVVARDWPRAAALAPGAGAIGPDIAEWFRLRAGEGTLSDYEAFLARRGDFPGTAFLRQRGEVAVARSATPDRVIRWFAAGAPATPGGSMALIRAYRGAGRTADAAAEARRAWVAFDFALDEETAFLALAGQDVASAHAARTERLLWDRKLAEARRMLPRLDPGHRALAEARIALIDGRDGVNPLIARVPPALAGDPGLAQDRFQWRMNKQLYDGAAELILERSAAGTLGRPEAWAARRAALARELDERGQHRLALRVAAGHGLTQGGAFADLEFLAGFIALRRLNDPMSALTHFRRLKEAVRTPISLSRADYWIGRAEESAGRGDAARAAYSAAARHQTTYYGLLSAERLGQEVDPRLVRPPAPGDWQQASFVRDPAFQAGRLFVRAGDRVNGRRFMLHLADRLDADGLDRLGGYALAANDPNLAVLVAKFAAERGVILSAPAFPVPDAVPEGLAVSRALALAIARRESEFDPLAQSPAGALGLMQVMPGTAELVAKELSLPYARGRLTSDPGYNVTLGAAYLKKLLDEFGPSVALIAAGYNAGPGRPRRWIGTLGDPRLPSVDPVDWVESVPISETRTYIMRVVEGLVIYRARLRGTGGPVRVIPELTGR
ncbi:MAG TPA: lytic transglycosylase domain-containing protein [Paracoccaceae bacterium]|nr:lytic transglycosylase domain-containing protein [Paracoccaceae bacterium]HMO72676.1 lytic transglycosylase domain-containing protein [Paracoccaceae bacterium]